MPPALLTAPPVGSPVHLWKQRSRRGERGREMKRAKIIQHRCQCNILGSPTFSMKGGHLDEKARDPLCQDTLTLKTFSGQRELNNPQVTACWKMPGMSQTLLAKQVCSRVPESNESHLAWHLVSHIPSSLDSYYTVNIAHLPFSSLIAFFFFLNYPFSLNDSMPPPKEERQSRTQKSSREEPPEARESALSWAHLNPGFPQRTPWGGGLGRGLGYPKVTGLRFLESPGVGCHYHSRCDTLF